MHASHEQTNPKFAHTLSGTIADERRHVGFGENRIGSLIREHPEKKPEVEKMQKEMAYHMLATFSSAFSRNRAAVEEGQRVTREAAKAAGGEDPARQWHGADLSTATPEEMEAVLADTVLKEFKIRLGRIGIEYQTPSAP